MYIYMHIKQRNNFFSTLKYTKPWNYDDRRNIIMQMCPRCNLYIRNKYDDTGDN
jgi:hypothetical protein